jgi:23S rRNA (cytosine1962-C5)-methyltransferase
MLSIYLKPGRDKPIRMGHPWVFSGAIAKKEGTGAAGELCSVVSASGEPLGIGCYNEHSAIRIRMLAGKGEMFDAAEVVGRIREAVARRASILATSTDSCRLVNSEGDRLPGLIVDKYAGGVCLQILTAGMERYRADVLDGLRRCCAPAFVYERSDTDARAREGLALQEGPVSGVIPQQLVVAENGLRFAADLVAGQKTGFFFDQRENRKLFRSYAGERSVCDCFCYSGGFSVYGLAGGARSVLMIDISDAAVLSAKENCLLNGFGAELHEGISADVFQFLRSTDRRFGCIVLDPPKFARHKGEVEAAARGYKDINLLALRNVEPGGIVFTFSCSNAVDPTMFRQIVFAAAADSRRFVTVLHVLAAGPDHPFNIAHREGEYLKGLALRVE